MPLTVSLQFPTGRYVASAWSDRDAAEWPPHPARLCLGLLDALHHAGNSPDERQALLWLCEQKAPEIVVPSKCRTDARLINGVYVPQNNFGREKKEIHPRSARSFPVVYLDADRPVVFFHWANAKASEAITGALRRLVARLPRLGHSTSLVFASLNFLPDINSDWRIFGETTANASGTFHLRAPSSQLIESAETAYAAEDRDNELRRLISKVQTTKDQSLKFSASPRGRYDPCHRWAAYLERKPGSNRVYPTPWDRDVLLLKRIKGSCLGLRSTWQVTEVLHKALLDRWHRSFSSETAPPWISGHAPKSGGGDPTGPVHHCHLALFPLPFVGHKHADGHLLGLGMALPKPEEIDLSPRQQRLDWDKTLAALLGETGSLELASAGRNWAMTLAPVSDPLPQQALSPLRWTEESRVWRSVTPVILHRHPKPHFKKDPVAWKESCRVILRESCAQLHLPAPVEIEPQFVSSIVGVPSSSSFAPPIPRVGRPPRFHIHANLEFAEPVSGPLLLGAGRYRGYGLFIPGPKSQVGTTHTYV